MGKTLMFLNPRKKRKGRRSSSRRRSHSRKARMFSNPRKASRRGKRRSGGRVGASLGGIKNSVSAAFRKDIVMIGLGLFATNTIQSVVWAKYGPRLAVDANGAMLDSDGKVTTDKTKQGVVATLPGAASPIGPLLYGIGIPVAVGMLTRRFSPYISQGAYLAAVSGLINTYLGPTVRNELNSIRALQATSAYVRGQVPMIPGVGRISGRPPVSGAGNFPGYPPIFPQNSMARR